MASPPPTVIFEDLQIRPFIAADTDQILAHLSEILAEYGFKIKYNASEKDCTDVPKYYASGEFWVVHDSTGHIVGTAAYRALRGSDPTVARVAELRRLYIKRTHRRRGLGGMLLAAIEDRAHTAGFATMVLESASALREATALYERDGYSSAALPEGLSISYRCDLVMAKPLHAATTRDTVRVLDEQGALFAHLPPDVARRGKMRIDGPQANTPSKEGTDRCSAFENADATVDTCRA